MYLNRSPNPLSHSSREAGGTNDKAVIGIEARGSRPAPTVVIRAPPFSFFGRVTVYQYLVLKISYCCIPVLLVVLFRLCDVCAATPLKG